MSTLGHLFSQNVEWSDKIRQQDPEFFKKLSNQQAPGYLWIGCSDSRVPANEIVGLLPGELFVHRNVANVVVHSDLNCLSVVQFAVDALKVKHIIVTGHYGCGGVAAALQNRKLGLIDNWLRHVQDVRQMHGSILDELEGEKAQIEMLCELNVIEQAVNVAQTTIVQDAWARGQELTIHGWIYGVHDGRLRDLNMTLDKPGDLGSVYGAALEACLSRKGVPIRARKRPLQV